MKLDEVQIGKQITVKFVTLFQYMNIDSKDTILIYIKLIALHCMMEHFEQYLPQLFKKYMIKTDKKNQGCMKSLQIFWL